MTLTDDNIQKDACKYKKGKTRIKRSMELTASLVVEELLLSSTASSSLLSTTALLLSSSVVAVITAPACVARIISSLVRILSRRRSIHLLVIISTSLIGQASLLRTSVFIVVVAVPVAIKVVSVLLGHIITTSCCSGSTISSVKGDRSVALVRIRGLHFVGCVVIITVVVVGHWSLGLCFGVLEKDIKRISIRL